MLVHYGLWPVLVLTSGECVCNEQIWQNLFGIAYSSSNSQKHSVGQNGQTRVAKRSHGHPVRVVEGERREHPSHVKTAICKHFLYISSFLQQLMKQ